MGVFMSTDYYGLLRIITAPIRQMMIDGESLEVEHIRYDIPIKTFMVRAYLF